MKRVTIDESRNRIYHITADDDCRNTYWEFVALDRVRFQKRIQDTAAIINSILNHNHRCKVFKERFEINTILQIMSFI